jgi:hypothetical protein
MGEARRVLDQLITGNAATVMLASQPSPLDARASPVKRSSPVLPWAIAAVAVIVAAGAGWKSWSAPPPEREPVTRTRQMFSEATGLVDISRDGTLIVFARSGGRQGFHLELRHMDQFDSQPLAGADGGVIGVFSPAADWIAFSTTDGKIKKVPSTGGPGILLADGSFFDGGAWGDDDTIAYPGANGLMRMPASGGNPVALTTVDKSKGEARHIRPQFLPGTQKLLFTVTYASADPQFAVLDLKKATYQTVGRSGDNGRYVDGYLLSVRSNTMFALPVQRHPSSRACRVSGPPTARPTTPSRGPDSCCISSRICMAARY